MKEIADEAAEGALRKFFLMIGVDVSGPAGILELQKDFAHTRSERLAVGKIRDKIYATVTGSVVTFFLGAVTYYITHGPK